MFDLVRLRFGDALRVIADVERQRVVRLRHNRGGDHAGRVRLHRWNDLLYAKWIDPVTSLIVCYDIIRRGDEDLRKLVRSVVLPNLTRYFSGIPDIAAVAEQVTPGSQSRPAEPPLFTEGLFAFPEWADKLPYPSDRLDYGALWTTWKGVVDAGEA